MNAYTIEKIADFFYDVYVSDDDGYTWEFYATYDDEKVARDEAEAAMDYISHGN